ncbi:AraC family transcriptional regulator [Streptomyces sp. XM4193]|uniref:helix-turn-helix transcriptional regulator n=1 Tax=Streptomyces sp. XM4193 TaxID=2929782 RepID=UPI001FF95E1D|nr:AraC family transcriptional regulator [Streptomyces sp. XM4193]MCK1794864.1 AraC family transcriptional regulator [Streptomyces sp. XM4193]
MGPHTGDPVWCREFGYGLGRPDGIMVLKYRSAGVLEFGRTRQDFLHQLYWSPDGMLTTLVGATPRFVGPQEAFWSRRAVDHEVRAADRQTVYRICLRQAPPALDAYPVGPASISPEAGRLVESLARPGVEEREALRIRSALLAGLALTEAGYLAHHAVGSGHARTVARELTRDPGDPTRLEEWASRLHTSVKTLQRDFQREFGMSFTAWRTRLRLSAARVLLATEPVGAVAHRVGYASASAFVQAYAARFGHTPGRRPPG